MDQPFKNMTIFLRVKWMHFLNPTEAYIVRWMINNPRFQGLRIYYPVPTAGSKQVIQSFVNYGIYGNPNNRDRAVLGQIINETQNKDCYSCKEEQSIDQCVHIIQFYNLKQRIFIQLMKLNQFGEVEQNRNYLPKLIRNDSGNTSTKVSSPFSMPEDSQIFRMKQKQKDKKRQLKAQNDKLKIWEKGVKKGGITIKDLNDLGKQQSGEEENQAKISLIEAAKSAIKNRVKVNEPMHEFISKKRQTLLFQMLIDHKREKINQFEEMTKLHRKGLQKAEKMLEEDMSAFNSYLNKNKQEAREAIKKAENQTRLKNQMVAKIKTKLQNQADLTGKNMSKRQTLQNLRKYKLFLKSLNPTITEEQRHEIEQQIQKQQQQTQSFNVANGSQNLQDSIDDDDIYFKQPDQLMSVFHSLQQSNLALMTNLKQMQQQIQQAKNAYNAKKQTMTKKKNQLMTNIQEVRKQITHVEQDIQQLRKTTNKDEISTYYAELESQIIRMAREIDFVPANQKHLNALELLKDIELNIEKQLDELKNAKMQKENVIKQLQKQCLTKKKQRKKQKNELQMLQEKNLKQRLQSSIQRQKRKGRPIMARSVIKREKKKKQDKVFQPDEEIEKRKYLLPD